MATISNMPSSDISSNKNRHCELNTYSGYEWYSSTKTSLFSRYQQIHSCSKHNNIIMKWKYDRSACPFFFLFFCYICGFLEWSYTFLSGEAASQCAQGLTTTPPGYKLMSLFRILQYVMAATGSMVMPSFIADVWTILVDFNDSFNLSKLSFLVTTFVRYGLYCAHAR